MEEQGRPARTRDRQHEQHPGGRASRPPEHEPVEVSLFRREDDVRPHVIR